MSDKLTIKDKHYRTIDYYGGDVAVSLDGRVVYVKSGLEADYFVGYRGRRKAAIISPTGRMVYKDVLRLVAMAWGDEYPEVSALLNEYAGRLRDIRDKEFRDRVTKEVMDSVLKGDTVRDIEAMYDIHYASVPKLRTKHNMKKGLANV